MHSKRFDSTLCQVNHADSVIVCISNIEFPICCGKPRWFVELRFREHPILEACTTVASKRLHFACLRVQYLDTIIIRVGKVEHAIDKADRLDMLQERVFTDAINIPKIEQPCADQSCDLSFICQGNSSNRTRLAICDV